MTGATPAIHLTRSATIRMIVNIQKVVPSMILSDKRNQTAPEKKTYLSNKIDELKNTVLCNNPAIDICCFTETFLTNLTDDARINVNGYNLFRKDRAQGAGGDILIYVLDK